MTTTETITEQDLVLRCRSGDTTAQHLLYKRYVGAMFHTILRLSASREDAEDLTQEVFVKVFQRLDTFRGESSVGAWIKRIAINTTLNFLRQANRLQMVELEHHSPVAEERDLDEEAWELDVHRIHEAIGSLPEGCRLVFNLHLLEGFRHQDVAKMLGITESTSKTQYMRAKRLLRQALGES